MKKNTPIKKKTVKAWVILLDGKLSHYDGGKEYVFPKTKKEAMKWHPKEEGYSAARCEITYTLP